MGIKNLFGLSYLMLVVLSQQVLAKGGPSYNQNINQDIKGAAGVVNQVITQDIDNPCPKSNSCINQNIKQDVSSKCGNPESINQNIEQKIKHGCNCIEQKSCRAIKNHEKRSNKPYAYEDIIFRRRHNKPGSKNRDSSEEVKICDCQQSSEISFKNHEDRYGDMSEDSSEEIRIKYGKKKPCEHETSEEIVLPKHEKRYHLLPEPFQKKHRFMSSEEDSFEDSSSSESREVVIVKKKCDSSEEKHHTSKPCSDEIIIRRTKPCGLTSSSSESSGSSSSSEESIGFNPVIRPCESQRFDLSSEEDSPKNCTQNGGKIVSSEESDENITPCPHRVEEKPCGCKKVQDSSSSEEIKVRPHFMPCKNPTISKESDESSKSKPCLDSSTSEEIIVKPNCKPVPRPLSSEENSSSDSSESSDSSGSSETIEVSVNRPKPCHDKIIHPPCQQKATKEMFRPCPPRPSCGQCKQCKPRQYHCKPVVVRPCPCQKPGALNIYF